MAFHLLFPNRGVMAQIIKQILRQTPLLMEISTTTRREVKLLLSLIKIEEMADKMEVARNHCCTENYPTPRYRQPVHQRTLLQLEMTIIAQIQASEKRKFLIT